MSANNDSASNVLFVTSQQSTLIRLHIFCFGQDPVKYHEAWKNLCETDGVIVPGGFGLRGVEGKMAAAKYVFAIINQ